MNRLLENWSFQRTVSILCFVFAGICLLLVVGQIYFFIMQDAPTVTAPPRQDAPLPQVVPPPKNDFFRGMPKESPLMLSIYSFGLLITLVAGLIVHKNLGKKEKKEVKTAVIGELLLAEERNVITLLEEHGNQLSQKEIVIKSHLSKLKVSRVIKRLESLHLVKKYPHGMTNKIILNLDKENKK